VKDFQKFNLYRIGMRSNFAMGDSAGAKISTSPPDSFVHKLPIPTIFHQVESEFAEALLVIDTSSIPVHSRHYMMLL